MLVAINSYKFNEVTFNKLHSIFDEIDEDENYEIVKIDDRIKIKSKFNNEIEFKNVNFKYDGSKK